MSDAVGAGDRWIPEDEYKLIQARVPILCVDVLLRSGGGPGALLGLIRRMTFDGDEAWCLIGGAVLRNEPVAEAVVRHIQATLGERLICDPETLRPLLLAQYFTSELSGRLRDPRKHAVSLTWIVEASGVAQPRHEALEFRWFERPELTGLTYGFGQGRVISRLLEAAERPARVEVI